MAIRCLRCATDYDTDDKRDLPDDCQAAKCVPTMSWRADRIMDYAKEKAIGLQLKGFIIQQMMELRTDLARPPTPPPTAKKKTRKTR